MLQMTDATCAFTVPLTLPNPNGIRIVGAGPYQSILLYTGASTTVDLLNLGSTAGAVTTNVFVANLRLRSSTTMTAGFALHVQKANNVTVQNVVVDGVAGAGNGKNSGGIWGDQVGNMAVWGGQIGATGDLVRVNGGLTASGAPQADFILNGTRMEGVGSNAVGVHIAGAFGGFSCNSYTSISGGKNSVLIDTAITAEGNREIFFNPGCILDAATSDGILVNDAGPITGGAGTLNLLGWIASSGRHNVNVQNWAAGWVTFGPGPIWNAQAGDNIHLSDATTNYVFPSARVSNASGWGINCTVPMTTVYFDPGPTFAANISGDVTTNCAPTTTIKAATTLNSLTVIGATVHTGTTQMVGNITGNNSTGLNFRQSGNFTLAAQGVALTLSSGANALDDQGGWLKQVNTGTGNPAPNKYSGVDHLGNMLWVASDGLTTLMTLSNAGALTPTSITGTPISGSTGSFTTVSASVAHFTTSSAPAISSCGTGSPAVAAGSSNQGGQFTTGTGTPTACTMTFANAFPTKAFCSVTPANAAAVAVSVYVSASSASAFTITLGSGTSTAAYNYSCNGN